MISEVVNALFLTYLASEYLLIADTDNSKISKNNKRHQHHQYHRTSSISIGAGNNDHPGSNTNNVNASINRQNVARLRLQHLQSSNNKNKNSNKSNEVYSNQDHVLLGNVNDNQNNFFAATADTSPTASPPPPPPPHWLSTIPTYRSRAIFILFFVVIVVNILDRVSGAMHIANELLHEVWHVPKIVFAAIAYVLALYFDIQRQLRQQYIEQQQQQQNGQHAKKSFHDSGFTIDGNVIPTMEVNEFLKKVSVAFLKVLPAYPFLAVLISFGFLFVINIWETLGLPLEWLNAPIYYGTLYGPFAWVYVHVKRDVCRYQITSPGHTLQDTYQSSLPV